MKKYFIVNLIFLISISFGYSQNKEVINLLIKDTSIVNNISKGFYDHPAIEIAVKTPFKEITKQGFPIRIAIDPGHIATNKKESLIEERYINSQYGFIYESELNMATALVLQKKLQERGFEVMLTRPVKGSALGVSYLKWYKKYAKTSLKEDLKNGFITKEKYNELIHADKKELFNKYFKDKDFQARANAINTFKPDITLVIHYNATEFDNGEEVQAPIVNYNYSVAFVPGSFTKQELGQDAQLEDFIKLASTDLLTKSVKLSTFIVNEFEKKLGAPRLLPESNTDLWYLKKYSIYTGNPGVYSRNLYLTRAVNSPVCYGEALLQNNNKEIKRLTEKDLIVKPFRVSSRVIDVADCYYIGVIKYFESLGWLK